MDESTVSLSNDSILIDDIETVFKNTSDLTEEIRDILNFGMGGNLIQVYRKFKIEFGKLFNYSSDHKSIRDLDLNKDVVKWRNTPGISYPQIVMGLKLFEQYKTELFKGQLLRYQ